MVVFCNRPCTPTPNFPILQHPFVMSSSRIPRTTSLSFSEFNQGAYSGTSRFGNSKVMFPCFRTQIQTCRRQQLLRFKRWLEFGLSGLYLLTQVTWKSTMQFDIAVMYCKKFPFNLSHRTPNTVRSGLLRCCHQQLNPEMCDFCFRIEDLRPEVSGQHLL